MLRFLIVSAILLTSVQASDTLFTHTTDGIESTVWITDSIPTSLEPIGISGAVTIIYITDYVYYAYVNRYYIILVGDWFRPNKIENLN